MTMPTPANPTTGDGCAGTGCDARDPWPLHHVRCPRGEVLSHLCTSCVLKSYAGSFCSLCLDLVDDILSASPSAVVRCRTCASVSHRTCLTNSDIASKFVCTSCSSGKLGFSYFFKESSQSDGKKRTIDLELAKALTAAARIAANSMVNAASIIRADAERKVREAVIAKKRAREMLEKMLTVTVKEEDEKARKNYGSSALVSVLQEEPKKKVVKVGSREIEKWMRFHEPIPLAMVQGRVEDVREKGREKKGNVSGLGGGGNVDEEEKRSVGNGDEGTRLTQSNQDALVSRTNLRPLFAGSPSTTTLHS